MSAALHVRFAGPGASIQDGGRHGYLRYGVTGAGPMDPFAHALANRALGNAAGATAIEVPLGGIEVEVEGAALTLAWAGGAFEVEFEGFAMPPAGVAVAEPGDRLRLRAGEAGVWCTLAVSGGLDIPKALGSASTHTRTNLGGLDGRTLRAGDRLPAARSHRDAIGLGRIVAPLLDRPPEAIRVLLGPQDDYFDADQIDAFLEGPWTVSARGDRMACFLDGAPIRHRSGYNIASDGIAMGAIQIPGEGKPIILMADRQSTGGYPKIANVIGADLGRLAQARPGTSLRFEGVGHTQAVAARAEEEAFLAGPIPLKPVTRSSFTTRYLLRRDLVDGSAAAPDIGVPDGEGESPPRLAAKARLDIVLDEGSWETNVARDSDALLLATGTILGRPAHVHARTGRAPLSAEDMEALAQFLARAGREGASLVGLFDAGEGPAAVHPRQGACLSAASERRSAPSVAVILGRASGFDALLAGMADFSVVSRTGGQAFLSGPAIARAVVNERLDASALGGADALSGDGGLADLVAANEVEALLAARRLADLAAPVVRPAAEAGEWNPCDGLETVLPLDPTAGYAIDPIVAALADGGEAVELGAERARNVLTSLARIADRPVGIVANRADTLAGALDGKACRKIESFAATCRRLRLTIVVLIDCPGFLPGSVEEHDGLARSASQLASVLAGIPSVSLTLRRGFGPAWAVLSARGTRLAWPDASVGDAKGVADPVGDGLIDAVVLPAQTRARVAEELARLEKDGSKGGGR